MDIQNIIILVTTSIIISTFRTLNTRAKVGTSHTRLFIFGVPTNLGFWLLVGLVATLDTGLGKLINGVITGICYQIGAHIGLIIGIYLDKQKGVINE